MTEHEYKNRHVKLWQEIVDYLHKTKRGYVKIDYKYMEGGKIKWIIGYIKWYLTMRNMNTGTKVKD